MSSVANDVLDSALPTLTISTSLMPDIQLDHPFAQGGAGPQGFNLGNVLVQLLRPRIVAQTPLGPVVIAPAGDPPYLWPVAAAVGVALVAGLVYLAVK